MSIQSESHKNGNGGSKLQTDENGWSESQKDKNGRCEISNGTSKIDAKLVESSGSTIDGNEMLALVEWLNYTVPYLRLPKDASEEEIRGCLIDGTVLCRILNKLCPGSVEMGGSSEPGFANVKRFLVAVEELGFPPFELLDLEQGSLVPVMRCLSALKASFDFGFWGENTKNETKKGGELLEIEYLRKIDRNQSFSRYGQQPNQNREGTKGSLDDSTSEVTIPPAILEQLKQGTNVDLIDIKILESIKTTSLDNASTRSLFTVGNKILEDSAERNSGDVPQHLAYLLRKVMQVIEQRFANQAVNLRIQNNMYKSREEKYQMKMKVLETLASGTSEEIQVVLKQLKQIKIEQFNIEEKQKIEEQDVLRLREEKDQMGLEISTLKQELQTAKSTYESQCLQLEENAKEGKLDLERKLKELESMLAGLKKNEKELEAAFESVSGKWKQKEGSYQSFVNYQDGALKELSAALESTRREIMSAKQSYSGEFNCMGLKLRGLADAADKYHVVLAENRKLYNEVQDLKGNIRVYCRIRPFLPGQSQKQSTIEYIGENGDLVIANPSKQRKDSRKLFKFNKVFGPAATQEEVFVDTRPLIRSVLDGYSVCIFAYGQTGSGKTYTMSGPSISSTEEWGVNYRALNDLFQISQTRKSSVEYEVGVQMVEIYNEQVLDLLSSDSSRRRLGIWNSTQPNGLAVPDASMHLVNSTADVLELMNIGLANRAVGATALNERSSRSHSVLTVHVCGVDLKTDTAIRGNLHLVDLAGSERVDRSEATGDRLREAQHINKSLSALGDVIFALAQKNPHVPYRNSKLTQVLQSSLGGQAKTLMFVQLNPDAQSFSETISTLKFAERVSGVELGAAKSNKEGRYVRELMEQVASLKETVAKKDEEIDRLLKANSNGVHRGMSVLRSASSSPRRYSVGSPRHSIGSPRQRKASSLVDKVAPYRDSFSEAADDNHSEVGFQLSMDDFRHQKQDSQRSKLAGHASQSFNEDFELLGFGDEDAGERLSDISDGGLSMGTETDGSMSSSAVEFTLFPEFTKPVESTTITPPEAKKTQAQNALVEKTPSHPSVRFAPTSKLPKPTPKLMETKGTRPSLVKSSSKVMPSPRKAIAGSSTSSLKSGKRWH
ncbi:kinesin-like protein KIN-14J [Argentina anserina]|uniref:kinesin-like protein KIN-14J n=1 Tax=Argentina anserina TaxID=57926 RepID=UPI002176492F|nr:kinesin-like protein KIN-14J [Potentilla anserina]